MAVVGPGYVHPDEFFQTVEITAGTVFSLQVFTPWEFANVHAPCRSIVPPFLFTGVPLLFLRWLDQLANRYFSVSLLTSKLIFVTPRLFMVVASLTVDCLLHQLSRQELCAMEEHTRTHMRPHDVEISLPPLSKLVVWCRMVVFASSWVVWVLQCRTLSNAFESLVFAVALYVTVSTFQEFQVLRNNNQFKWVLCKKGVILGALIGFGFFTRFTYVLFHTPLALYLLYLSLQKCFSICGESGSVRAAVEAVAFLTLAHVTGIFLAALPCVLIDSFYFQSSLSFPPEKWILAPVNNMLYNILHSSEHGAHPCYLHLLVNFQLLFGPLGVLTLASLTLILLQVCKRTLRYKHQTLLLFYLSATVFPLLLLSIAPHQEARFLLPLLLPTVLHTVTRTRVVAASMNAKRLIFLLVVWLLFNLSVGVFYAFFHQGGVLPSLMQLSSHVSSCDSSFSNSSIIYYNTYMPPRHLLLLLKKGKADMQLADLAGSSMHRACRAVSDAQQFGRVTFLVTPLTTFSHLHSLCNQTLSSFRLKSTFFPHISTEQLFETISNSYLGLFVSPSV